MINENAAILKSVNDVLIKLNEGIGQRDHLFNDINNAIFQLRLVVESVQAKVEKIAASVDGNGQGLKTRMLLAEEKIKVLDGSRIAPSRMREILLGAAITILIGIAMFLIGRAARAQ
jgi:hypothetical protein